MHPTRYLLAAILVVSVALATACQSDAEDATIGGQLRIFNWDDYFAPTTIEDFEAEFGIDAVLDTFEDEQAMLAVIQSDPSQYDVIIASDSVITDMIDLRLLAHLEPGSMPNLANMAPEFTTPAWDPGNEYSVLTLTRFSGLLAS